MCDKNPIGTPNISLTRDEWLIVAAPGTVSVSGFKGWFLCKNLGLVINTYDR